MSYGLDWTPRFIRKVYRCAYEFLSYDARRLEAQIENQKFQQEAAVN